MSRAGRSVRGIPDDAWVVAPTGERYWGRFGAAGLLALDPQRGVLLQHRVSWSHFGDTWALPGGARHEGESATDGALREAAEEAGVPDAAIRPRLLSILDLGYWSYTTLVGDVAVPFEPTISDPESRELAWVPADAVAERPLHPGFESSWAQLRPLLGIRPAIVVDVANVMGSVPDGWWRDRAGAAERLIARVDDSREPPGSRRRRSSCPSTPGSRSGSPSSRGRRATPVRMRRASRSSGPRHPVTTRSSRRRPSLVAAGRRVTVVTSDRGLVDRVTDAGAAARGARWLLDLLG